MSTGSFDDQPQWYLALARTYGDGPSLAGKRVVVACGQRELWHRVRTEIDADEKCSWWSLGPKDGDVSVEHCFAWLLVARENYGADLNHLVLELAQIPSFAAFLRNAPVGLCNFVSNPLGTSALPREPYSHEALVRLAARVEATLSLEPSDWWQ